MWNSTASGRCVSRLAIRGLAALLLTVWPGAVCLAQAPARESEGAVVAFGGSITMGPGASLSVKDALEGSSGVSGVFRPRFNAGLRLESRRGWFGFAIEASTMMVESPVTMIRWGSPQSRRTIRYMDTGGSLLWTVRGALPVAQPYAGLGPSLLVSHADSEGGIRLTAGLLFIAGVQISIGPRLFGFAEGRCNLLPRRHYTFDMVGVQDPVFPTVAATVSGSHSSVVFGVGLRFRNR